MKVKIGDDARAKYILVARAARMIQNSADCLRQCHAPNGDWRADRATQQIHDEEVATAKALRALIVGAPEKTLPRIPEGDVLLHLARAVGLRNAMPGIDATRVKDLLWMFLAKAIAVMDETDVVDAELPAPAINYADDLAVAEHVRSDNGARRG
ncbi:hypothetical protein PQR64_23430 [Paraburkholderia phytofirmans]|uniref:hypothetical protein n=1 Tax=Paraburkholderia phytofirmans TaxID=261302 RepID=UPI0038B7A88A